MQNCNHQFHEEEYITLSHIPLDVQCKVLLIQVKTRENIIILVKNMINLQTLHVQCQDEKYSKRLALTENDNDELHDEKTSNKDELVQWLKNRLLSNYFIVTNPYLVYDISIWID